MHIQINTYYYTAIFIWSIIMVVQFYNGGCFLLEIERYLFDSNAYGGIWEHIVPLNIKKNDPSAKKKKTNIVRTIGFLFYLLIFLRILFV